MMKIFDPHYSVGLPNVHDEAHAVKVFFYFSSPAIFDANQA